MTRRPADLPTPEADTGLGLLEQTLDSCQRTLGDIAPLIIIGVGLGRQPGEDEPPTDPLAAALADEAIRLLGGAEPDLLGIYLCLEVAAARAGLGYRYAFHRYRDWLMRTLLGVVRGHGLLASVRETTLPESCWTSARSQYWVMTRGDQLLLYRGQHQVAILHRDRGMRDDFDA